MRTKVFDKGWRQWGLLAVLLLGVAGTCAAQSTGVGPLSHEGARDAGASNQPTPPLLPLPPAEEKSLYSNDNATEAQIRLRKVYLAQEVQMVKDTRKLLQLASKLNTEVASQHGGALTPAELREVAQIEKLARSVRTKMEAPVPSSLFQTGPTNTNIYFSR